MSTPTRRHSSLPTRSFPTRTVGVAGAVAVLGLGTSLVLAGPASASSTARAVPRCTTAQLDVDVVPGDAGAGQRYATVVLHNGSRATCTVSGYGGLALLGAPGQGVPTDLRRVAPPNRPTPEVVRLAPGASAHSLLHWAAVPAEDETGTPCQPVATSVVVTPPNQRTAAVVAWAGDEVCQHGRIDQLPYASGAHA